MFEVYYLPQFSKEFVNYPIDQQDKILGFVSTFQRCGLADFLKYDGKITPSWKGLDATEHLYHYARDNELWHYHIGIPRYRQVHDT
jgi:hypothetical protein